MRLFPCLLALVIGIVSVIFCTPLYEVLWLPSPPKVFVYNRAEVQLNEETSATPDVPLLGRLPDPPRENVRLSEDAWTQWMRCCIFRAVAEAHSIRMTTVIADMKSAKAQWDHLSPQNHTTFDRDIEDLQKAIDDGHEARQRAVDIECATHLDLGAIFGPCSPVWRSSTQDVLWSEDGDDDSD